MASRAAFVEGPQLPAFERPTKRQIATEKKLVRTLFVRATIWFNGDLMRGAGFGMMPGVLHRPAGDTFRWKGRDVATHRGEARWPGDSQI